MSPDHESPYRMSDTSDQFLTLLLTRVPRLVVVGAASVVLAALVIVLLVPRRFLASITVAAVSSSGIQGKLGGLAALSGVDASEGLEATPDLISALLSGRRALLAVGMSAPPGGTGTVYGAATSADDTAPRLSDVLKAMSGLSDVVVDRKTGLVTVYVQHRDSALARVIATRIVEEGTKAFEEASRAQATAQRRGQEQRVDSMARQLDRAENAMVEFLGRNRVVASYSQASAERDRLQRNISFATQAYSQAVAEREGALAHELEATPALVVIDPLPGQLTPMSKHVVFYAFACAFLALAGITSWWFARWRLAQGLALGQANAVAVADLVAPWPVLRRLLPAGRTPPRA